MIILWLLTVAEHIDIKLPNYKYTDILGKKIMHEYCLKSEVLSMFLPEGCNYEGIGKEFYISVFN